MPKEKTKIGIAAGGVIALALASTFISSNPSINNEDKEAYIQARNTLFEKIEQKESLTYDEYLMAIKVYKAEIKESKGIKLENVKRKEIPSQLHNYFKLHGIK